MSLLPLESDLAHVTRQVGDAVDYLRIGVDAPPDDGWIQCSSLIEHPRRLGELIRSTATGRGTAVDAVAASLFVQGYAFRVASAILAPYALGLPSPGCRPDATHIRINRNRPAAVAVTDHALSFRSPAHLAQELLGGHLAPLITAVTESTTVGRRLLWGNVAASTATLFRAFDGSADADREAVQLRATDFFEAARSWLHGYGAFESVEEAGLTGWYWTRTNCCLWYQCSGGSRCDDCSLHTSAEVESIRRVQLRDSARPAAHTAEREEGAAE